MPPFETALRLTDHTNHHILCEDADLIVIESSHSESTKILRAFLEHAPSRNGRSFVANNILGLQMKREAEYRAKMETAAKDIAKKIAGGVDEEVTEEAIEEHPDWRPLELSATKQAQALLKRDLGKLANHYMNAILRPFRGIKGPEIEPNPCWNRETIYVEPGNASRRDKKEAIIPRDNYRCCATGRIDVIFAELSTLPRAKVLEGPYRPGNLDSLQVAHVFPYAFNKFDDRDKTRVEKARLIWTAFRDFSGFKVEDLAGEKINGEGNLFMLAPVAHKLYDRLELWFELQDSYGRSHKVKVADCYEGMLGKLDIVKLDKQVDRRWLAIHRSLCLISRDISD